MNSRHTMIDLFAGCGGLSLGFEQAGFRPLLCSEINESARRSEIKYVNDVYDISKKLLTGFLKEWPINQLNEIDIVCGGPPCQGYSGIGHRRTHRINKIDIPSNQLYMQMVKIISIVKPRSFLFENVKGLLCGRWTKEGVKGEIWKDVKEAFFKIPNYSVKWRLVYAKDYGVPQNRPRIIMIGFRNDVISNSKIATNERIGEDALEANFLPLGQADPPSMIDLLSDLVDKNYKEYYKTDFYPSNAESIIQTELRTQGNVTSRKGDPISEQVYSKHSDKVVDKFEKMIASGGAIPLEYQNKKFAQRVLPKVWGQAGPTITATSMPDDYVHYEQPRAPTVREWARIQTFPDWYRFEGPRTTGGERRAGNPTLGIWEREVPKYTQIGNAVPVKMATAIAKHIKNILTGENSEE